MQNAKNGMNLIKTDADVERAWVSALWDIQIDDSMHTLPSEDKLEKYENDADVIPTGPRSKITSLMAEKADYIYPKRTWAEV